jgi:hypothetical protein
VSDFVGAVAAAAGDEEASKRASKAAPAVQRLAAGEHVWGWPTLARLLGGRGPEVVARVRDWLGVDSTNATLSGRPDGNGGGASNRQEPDLVCLADVQPRKVSWLWYGRIPLGRISLLVGRPGSGKSFVACDLAARVSTNAPWPDPGLDRAPLGDTLLICAEDDPADTIRPRLDAAGADCRRVHLLRAAKVVSDDGGEQLVAFDLSNVDLIRDALGQLPGCKLVVVDPIGSFLGGQVDSNKDNTVRSLLMPLAAIASEYGVAVVLVCHTRKALAPFADDMPLGSRAFVGLSRSVLHVAADPGDERRKLLLPGKCNLCPPPPGLAFRIVGDPGRLEWEPDPVEGIRADDIVTAAAGRQSGRGPEAEARAQAAEWLTDLLHNGPMLVKAIKAEAQAAGLRWRTVRRAQESLGVVVRRRGFGSAGAWEWALPIGGHIPIDDQVSPIDGQVSENLATYGESQRKSSENPRGFPIDGQVSENLATYGDGPNTASPPGGNGPDGPATKGGLPVAESRVEGLDVFEVDLEE